MRRIFVVSICFIVTFLILAIAGISIFGVRNATAASEATLSRAQSGLVFSDSLNTSQSQSQLQTQTNGNWSFGGHYNSYHIDYAGQNWQYAANGTKYNTVVAFSEGQSGLSITVKAVSTGPYTGFYAISPPSDAELFHARITSTYTSIPDGFLQVGLFVRAASGNTNYIACASVSSSAGTHWEIIHGTGNTVEATNFAYLWIDNATSQPSTADCTIITNGNNYLAVVLNGALVYQNTGLALGVQKPVAAYLGVESSYSTQAFSGSWTDFYSTQTDSVEAINLPSTATNLTIVNQNGTSLGSSSAINGTAVVNIAKYNFPLLAYLKAYDSSGKEIATTPAPVELMGGDIYSAKATIQQQVGSVVGFVSDPTFFYVLIPIVIVVLAMSLVLSYRRRR
jgi:hypothetical protein